MKKAMKTSRRRRKPQAKHEENIFNPFAPMVEGFRRWRAATKREGGSFRDAFVTVLLLHVIGVLAIMAYGSFKKAMTPAKTAKQAEEQTHKAAVLPDILRKSPQELIAAGDAKPGDRLEAVREKDPFAAKPAKTEKQKPAQLIAKDDESLPPLAPSASKPGWLPATTIQPSALLAGIDKTEATKKAFLEATGRSQKIQESPIVKEPEIRKAEQVVKQIQELAPVPAQNSAPAPTEYVVGSGDNIYTVSKRLNVSYAELAKANNLASPRDLRVGQTLVLPRGDNL